MSSKLHWNEALVTGVDEIDDDHRALFALLAELQSTTGDGLLGNTTGEALSKLHDYATAHFTREEALMERIAYAGYAAHKTQHARFVNELAALQSRVERGARTPQLDIVSFLNQWLQDHVLKMDHALAIDLKKAQI